MSNHFGLILVLWLNSVSSQRSGLLHNSQGETPNHAHHSSTVCCTSFFPQLKRHGESGEVGPLLDPAPECRFFSTVETSSLQPNVPHLFFSLLVMPKQSLVATNIRPSRPSYLSSSWMLYPSSYSKSHPRSLLRSLIALTTIQLTFLTGWLTKIS